ncbi:MAG: calcium-translocating P-type ATPase, SERCA-type [Candidatus Aenigmatarchaeota archaeon]
MPSVTEWHMLGADEAIKALNSQSSGLESAEARSRLKEHGLNQIVQKGGKSRFSIFANQFKSFLVLLLAGAAVFSFLIGQALDAVVIGFILILNAILGFVQEAKAENAVEALKKLMTPKATVIRDGKTAEVFAKELVPGDIVVLEEGCQIPADLRIIKSVSLRVDESSLTGESTPVSKNIVALHDVPMADRRNMAFMGTTVSFGRGQGIVVSTGMGTEMGRIAKMVDRPEETTPLQKQLASLGKTIGIITLLISIIVISGGILRNHDVADMVMTGIALAVAAVPEGLPAVVTITLALGVQRMSSRKAIVRRLPAVETLGAVDVICSDKTGTLTENQMTVRKIWTDDKTITVTGRGYSSTGEFHIMGRHIRPEHHKSLMMLLRCAGFCNNADVRSGSPIGDPTEAALFVMAEKVLDIRKLRAHFKRVGEIPFSSERKMMSTIYRGDNREGLFFTKGAPEKVLHRCDRIFLGGRVVSLTAEKRKEILGYNSKMASDALRMLGFAYKPATDETEAEEHEERNLIFLGLAGMIDPPRKEVLPSLKMCKDAGIRVVMITGDHHETARAIAKELGLYKEGDKIISGEEMASMTDGELKDIISNVPVFARVSPGDKLRIIRLLKSKGHTVAMTGDGVNDAPALKRADIGVAMGIRGTDVAKEASDMILADDNFRTIVAAVREGRAIYDNIRKFVQFLLSSNIGEVLVIFLALLIGFYDSSGMVLPLTAIQLLWINLLTDGLPAISLGMDPAPRDIMSRPPREKKGMIGFHFLSDVLFVGVMICIGTLSLFSYGMAMGDTAKAMTLAFTSLVVFEMVILYAIKHEYKTKLLDNRLLVISVAATLLLQLAVVYVPVLQHIFDTVALGIIDWAYMFLVTCVMLLVVELKYRYLG